MIFELPKLEECKIAVIGLGYVGLPLAIEFAKCKISKIDKNHLKRYVIGFDIDEKRINELNSGLDITNETNLKEINVLDNLEFTCDKKRLIQADIFIVTVPTPIDDSKKPNLEYLQRACELIGSALKENSSDSSPIVIFESTVYPGATDEVLCQF